MTRPDSLSDYTPLFFRLTVAGVHLILGLACACLGATQTEQLRCEYRVNPLGLDCLNPRLSWQISSAERGEKQVAYRILVASSAEQLKAGVGDLWDSGRVPSDQTVNIAYGGNALGSRRQCYWKVCAWDAGDKAHWSEPAAWSMGLLQPQDWQASYIAFRDPSSVWKDPTHLFLPPARQYRRQFGVSKTVKRAMVYATALGIYELHLNGQRVGDSRFAPGWTDYHQRAYYNTYDVTSLLKRGENVLGAWVADGWYSGYLGFGLLTGIGTERIGRYTYGKTPAVMAQLELEYTDGTREIVPTDKTWKGTGDGPIREADLLMGELYDARKETREWTNPGFDDRQWEGAIPAAENGGTSATFYEWTDGVLPDGTPGIKGRAVNLGFQRPPKLEAFVGVPVRPIEELRPKAVTSPTNGVYIFNLGQNFAGVVCLKVKGPAGTVVQLRYGEMLQPDGRLMNQNYRKARALDRYILRGDPHGEEWTPRFTYHGFQYVEVTGYPGRPGPEAITGVVLHSDTPLTSVFECSDPMANRLFQNIVWTQRANFVDLPTDCPQRDERFGWLGDAQIYAGCATLNADVAAFYTKWLREVMEAQQPSGVFSDFAPHPFQHGWAFGPAWCDAGVICPWTLWQAYGDTNIIERCWPNMVRFLAWRTSRSKDFLGSGSGNEWGDWLSFGNKTPIEYVDMVYFAYSARLMSEMALATGKTEASEGYRRLFENIKAAFNRKYVGADGRLEVDTETAYALALYMDLIPAELRAKMGKILADGLRVHETADNSGMTTGFLGTRPLLPVLTSAGENELALKVFQSHKFPSWGYEVEQGATTVWERWDSYTKANGFGGVDGAQNGSMNSFAHYSFGAVGEWMLGELAGIQSDGPGYCRIIIHPHPPSPGPGSFPEPIHWVNAHYDSIHGRIVSQWRRTLTEFELKTQIPANTTATVYLLANGADSVIEGGKPLAQVKGVRFLRLEGDCAVLAVESGQYHFLSSLNRNVTARQ